MKRSVWVLLLLVVFVLASVTSAHAQSSYQIVYEVPEITDLGVLKHRALKGITDIDDLRIESVIGVQQLTGDPREFATNTIRTTQKVREIRNSDDSITSEYVTTEITTLAVNLSQQSHQYLFSDLMSCYLKIYWSDETYDNKHYGKVTKSSVRFVRLDSQAGVRNLELKAGQAGQVLGGYWGMYTSEATTEATVSMNQEYFANGGSSWPYVWYSAGLANHYLQAWQKCTVFRGTTTWSWNQTFSITSY